MSCRGLANESGVRIRAAAATRACLTIGGRALDSVTAFIILDGSNHEFPDGDFGNIIGMERAEKSITLVNMYLFAALGFLGIL